MIRRHRLVEFMTAMGQHISCAPEVPPDRVARLRARLILEEAFEFAEASFGESSRLGELKELTLALVAMADVRFDLPKAADALEDLDYVVEGSRVSLGISEAATSEIAAAVHAANMAKASGPVDEYGKKLKPEGWTPPDVAAILREHGWEG